MKQLLIFYFLLSTFCLHSQDILTLTHRTSKHYKVDDPETTKRKAIGPILDSVSVPPAYLVLQWIKVETHGEPYYQPNVAIASARYIDEVISGYFDQDGQFLKGGHRCMYKAILFFDSESLANFLKANELNEYIIFDIKKGTQTLSR